MDTKKRLAQLIAENERLKIGEPCEQPLVDMPMDRQIVMLNRQLTATEAKLETVTSNGWLRHAGNCQLSLVYSCTCGLTEFLSTLTAEKKEEAK